MESSLRNQTWRYDSVTIGYLGSLKSSLKDISGILPIYNTIDETVVRAAEQKGAVATLTQIIKDIEDIDER